MSGLYKNGTYMPLFHHINPQNPIEFNNNGVYPTIPTYDRTIYFLLYSSFRETMKWFKYIYSHSIFYRKQKIKKKIDGI